MKESKGMLEQINQRFGPNGLDLILKIYVNFYFSELDIIEICAKWIGRRELVKEKFYLVWHANDEVEHASLFKSGIERLGFEVTPQLIDKYKVQDVHDRFQKLLRTDDELEVLVGLNLYSEGVLALAELEELGSRMPDIFPEFKKIAKDEHAHFGYGKAVARRMFKELPHAQSRAQKHLDWYRDHLVPYLWEDISEEIDLGIRAGAVGPRYRQMVVERFETLTKSIGLSVSWPKNAVERLRTA